MSTSKTIADAVKAASKNKAVRGIAVSASAAAARHIGPIAQERYSSWRDRRLDRDRAIKLARQKGGRYSEDTIIDGERHFVVWKDGAPVQAFPSVENLAERPELADFDQRLAHEPPPARRKPRPPGGGAPPGAQE